MIDLKRPAGPWLHAINSLLLIRVRTELDRLRGCRRRFRLAHRRSCWARPVEIGIGAVEIAPILESVAGGADEQGQAREEAFHNSMEPNGRRGVERKPTRKRRLRRGDLSRRVCLRQGLWTEDLRTPPEQDCSNGSLILLAVALWRTFF